MIKNVFIKKMRVLYERLIVDYWDGEELVESAKAITLLCHNFIELGKMDDSKDKIKKD